ncbi:hypothetical protein, partial [Chromobacterium subtsugae]|uniref:hypothetical protein n=1 Tax=Chromobacterium subtsugae TaxID=251747 RepID=UPI000A81CC1C
GKMLALKRIVYDKLTPRQQEHYNFQKVAAALADYGYYCEWQPDSVSGVDFLPSMLMARLSSVCN